jgi:hypothetical protein
MHAARAKRTVCHLNDAAKAAMRDYGAALAEADKTSKSKWLFPSRQRAYHPPACRANWGLAAAAGLGRTR